jgi:hypothetical protein
MPSNRRTQSETRKPRSTALSMSVRSSRIPSVEMDTIDDVATLICVEISRAIMTRPEINTGSLFSLIAASNSLVNKSDAVLVITAAILKSIGNNKGSDKILNRSQTVTNYYKDMRLTDDNLRNSFVIMLFALAPEFVKMIESSTSIALNRVKEMTVAPHSNTRMLVAANELMRGENITNEEHVSIMNDFAEATMGIREIDYTEASSIVATPTDGITFDDSASRLAKSKLPEDPDEINSVNLLRFTKRHSLDRHKEFYKRYPKAKRPIELSSHVDKNGLGYSNAESVVIDTVSESGFTSAINSLFNRSPVSKRPIISKEDTSPLRKMPVRFRKQSETDDELEIKARQSSDINKYKDVVVTREDVENKLNTSGNIDLNASEVITAQDDIDEMRELLSLL